jgi:hypothetical protein
MELERELLSPKHVGEEVLMNYELIALLIVPAIPLGAGLALVADAVRRGLREGPGENHDLHA